MLTYHRDLLEPNCNQTLAETILDMQLLSQLTTRLRLYSPECNQTAMVLEAIKQSKTNLNVFLGMYRGAHEDDYQRQKTALREALQTYGTSNILGITVDHVRAVRPAPVNDTKDVDMMERDFRDIDQMLRSINVDIQIGPVDGASFNTTFPDNWDFRCAFIIPQRLTTKVADLFLSSSSMVRVDPWDRKRPIQDAAKWSFDFFDEANLGLTRFRQQPKPTYMVEVGWPTNAESTSFNRSAPSVENLQIFINNFVCVANTQGVRYL